MTITTKHKFQSAKADSGDASLIRPSNWNDDHSITLATSKLMGRYTAGTGAVQEVGLGANLAFSAGNLDFSAAANAALAAKASLASPVFTGDPRAVTDAATVSDTSIATHAAVYAMAAYLNPGLIHGFTTGNSSGDANNDIDVSAGLCCATQASPVLMRLAATLTKQMDVAWAVGSNAGCLDTGVIGNGVYHIYAINRPDTNVTDILASLSPTAPTLPANYTMSRRIGSVIRLAGANLGFVQNGDEFLLKIPRLDIDVGGQGTAAILRALSVPTGISTIALIRAQGMNAAGWQMLISSPDVDDVAPAFSVAPLYNLRGGAGDFDNDELRVRTNTSAQVRSRSTQAGTDLRIVTCGWIDTRGKDF